MPDGVVMNDVETFQEAQSVELPRRQARLLAQLAQGSLPRLLARFGRAADGLPRAAHVIPRGPAELKEFVRPPRGVGPDDVAGDHVVADVHLGWKDSRR